jgi:hypothetical protein
VAARSVRCGVCRWKPKDLNALQYATPMHSLLHPALSCRTLPRRPTSTPSCLLLNYCTALSLPFAMPPSPPHHPGMCTCSWSMAHAVWWTRSPLHAACSWTTPYSRWGTQGGRQQQQQRQEQQQQEQQGFHSLAAVLVMLGGAVLVVRPKPGWKHGPAAAAPILISAATLTCLTPDAPWSWLQDGQEFLKLLLMQLETVFGASSNQVRALQQVHAALQVELPSCSSAVLPALKSQPVCHPAA